MAIDRLTPDRRREIESKYRDQSLVLGNMARSFDFGAIILESVHEDIGVVGNLLAKRGINDVLRALDQFKKDIDSCMSGLNSEKNAYDPREVLSKLVPQNSEPGGHKLDMIDDTFLNTKGTLLLTKHGVIVPRVYLQRGSGFLFMLRGIYGVYAEEYFRIANDVQWSTNPRTNI